MKHGINYRLEVLFHHIVPKIDNVCLFGIEKMYIKKEVYFFFIYLDLVGTSATKLCVASSFVQEKVEGYFSIQNFDLRGT